MPKFGGLVLYGAGPASSNLWKNNIFARWLQKKATITNGYVSLIQPLGKGPDASVLKAAGISSMETGMMKVYDSDGTTLLYTSPQVTFRVGYIWQYNP